jgi:peroxiredoxin
MTQLVELREGQEKFKEAGVKLYAISYDDKEVLKTFSDAYDIGYPLLSDLDSAVIKKFGILNTQIKPGDAILYGIPYPGTYVVDEDGVVMEKFFHDTYKRREGPELIIDSALGKVTLADDAPMAGETDDEGVTVTAALHGGPIKQGAQREIIVRFDLPNGLHIYGKPVPEGMIPAEVTVDGPQGLVVEPLIAPPTEPLRLESLDLELPVWSGTVDFRIPIYALSSLASECRPLDKDAIEVTVSVRYQACDDNVCLLPKTETFTLTAPVEAVHVQSIGLHMGHGQQEATFDGAPHLRRLIWRKVRGHPLGFLRYVWQSLKLNRAARKRGA